MVDNFEHFTKRAKRVMELAHEEARRLNHEQTGTEHMLLGLVREGHGVAARVLQDLGVEVDEVRSKVESMTGRGDRVVGGELELTPRAGESIELAGSEARELGHRFIGTEHLLLGLVRQGQGKAVGILQSLGVPPSEVRSRTLALVSGSPDAGARDDLPADVASTGLALEMLTTLFDYSMWARDRFLGVVEKVEESKLREGGRQGVYGSIFDTLAHMAASEWQWLQRCKGESPLSVPRGADFADLRVLVDWWNATHAGIQGYLAGITEPDLSREVSYAGSDGKTRTRKVWHMLLQAANHQTEHRAQVANMLSELGYEVPQTDLVVYLSQGQ